MSKRKMVYCLVLVALCLIVEISIVAGEIIIGGVVLIVLLILLRDFFLKDSFKGKNKKFIADKAGHFLEGLGDRKLTITYDYPAIKKLETEEIYIKAAKIKIELGKTLKFIVNNGCILEINENDRVDFTGNKMVVTLKSDKRPYVGKIYMKGIKKKKG